MQRRMIILGTMLLLLAAVIMPVAAQDQPANNMEILREKLQADKKLVVAANLGLTQKEADGFWPLYEEYQRELRALNDRTIAMINKYANAYYSMTDEIAKGLTNEYLEIQEQRIRLLKNHLLNVQKVLPGKKVARYMQIENKISAVIDYDLAAQIPFVE